MELIAMKCTREQYESVRDKVGELHSTSESDFSRYNYLNNDEEGVFMHLKEGVDITSIYEEFNKDTLFKALGIEAEEKFEISKEVVLKYDMREEFPECFKIKMEVGKVYKNGDSIFRVIEVGDNLARAYGFHKGIFKSGSFSLKSAVNDLEATQEEWKEALINETKKRGLLGVSCHILLNKKVYQLEEEIGKFQVSGSLLFYQGALIMCDDVWAEIVPKEIIQNGVTYIIKD